MTSPYISPRLRPAEGSPRTHARQGDSPAKQLANARKRAKLQELKESARLLEAEVTDNLLSPIDGIHELQMELLEDRIGQHMEDLGQRLDGKNIENPLTLPHVRKEKVSKAHLAGKNAVDRKTISDKNVGIKQTGKQAERKKIPDKNVGIEKKTVEPVVTRTSTETRVAKIVQDELRRLLKRKWGNRKQNLVSKAKATSQVQEVRSSELRQTGPELEAQVALTAPETPADGEEGTKGPSTPTVQRPAQTYWTQQQGLQRDAEAESTASAGQAPGGGGQGGGGARTPVVTRSAGPQLGESSLVGTPLPVSSSATNALSSGEDLDLHQTQTAEVLATLASRHAQHEPSITELEELVTTSNDANLEALRRIEVQVLAFMMLCISPVLRYHFAAYAYAQDIWDEVEGWVVTANELRGPTLMLEMKRQKMRAGDFVTTYFDGIRHQAKQLIQAGIPLLQRVDKVIAATQAMEARRSVVEATLRSPLVDVAVGETAIPQSAPNVTSQDMCRTRAGSYTRTFVRPALARMANLATLREEMLLVGTSPERNLQGPFCIGIRMEVYLLVAVDDHSGWNAVVPMRLKSESAGWIIAIIRNWMGLLLGVAFRCLRTDQAKEFLVPELTNWLASVQAKHEVSSVYCPQQNGVAERFNGVVASMARTMLIESEMSKGFWTYAFTCASYFRNRLPSKRGATPYERFFGQVPDVSLLRVFGTRCYVKLLDAKLEVKLTNAQSGASSPAVIGEGPPVVVGIEHDAAHLVNGPDAGFHMNLRSRKSAEPIDAGVPALDIKTAFLNATLEEGLDLYLAQQEGFEVGKGLVCKIIKSLYGLKQAPRLWSAEVCRVLRLCGFRPTASDPALFVRLEADGNWSWVTTYVDDFWLALDELFLYIAIIEIMRQEGWTVTEMGVPRMFLSLDCDLSLDAEGRCDKIVISQRTAIQGMLERFRIGKGEATRACGPYGLRGSNYSG
eukprot:gene24720-biopygen19164